MTEPTSPTTDSADGATPAHRRAPRSPQLRNTEAPGTSVHWPGRLLALLAGTSVATLAGLLLVTSCGSPGRQRVGPYDSSLRQVNEQRGNLAWDGLVTGMTFAQVEQAVGQRLGVPTGPGPLCGRYSVDATVLDQRLELSFDGPTAGARLKSFTLLLPAPPSGFDREEVLPALEARLGELEWIPSQHAPERSEAEIRKPLYRTSGGGLVFLNPERGITLGDVCYD